MVQMDDARQPSNDRGRTFRRQHGERELKCANCGRRLDTGFMAREGVDPETGKQRVAWVCAGCGYRAEEMI
jgi:hypothetical protein